MLFKKSKVFYLIMISLFVSGLFSRDLSAQSLNDKLTLNQAIDIAQSSSANAQIAELNFMSEYWKYRSYKADLLPSFNLDGNVGSYNRSIIEVRDPNTGQINYVPNNTLRNDLGLSIDQKVGLTGGTVSLRTSLLRLDQFDYNNKYYSSVPLSLTYIQPLRGFNTVKWEKRVAPLEYTNAKGRYLETMENITLFVSNYFFSVLSAQTVYRNSINTHDDIRDMYEIAQKRFDIGTITKNELLQLELSLLNSDLTVSNSQLTLEEVLFDFKSFLGIPESSIIELIAPLTIPKVTMNYDFVLTRALTNSTHKTSQELKMVNAERDVAQAKSRRGIQMALNVNVGLSQTNEKLAGAYTNLRDMEMVGLTFSMPIYDWGMSKGRIKMMEAQAELAQTEVDLQEVQFRQDIKIKVMDFNNKAKQCEISQKALSIAEQRYDIMKKRFQNGGVTVTDLNTSQTEFNNASSQYVSQLKSFWGAYYEIRKLSLYDFINQEDIDVDFEKLIE